MQKLYHQTSGILYSILIRFKLLISQISRIQQETGVGSLREIPDKPPPPYTPPASPSSKVLRLKTKEPESTRFVPSSKEEISNLCLKMSQLVFDLHQEASSGDDTEDKDETKQKFLSKLQNMVVPEEMLEVINV